MIQAGWGPLEPECYQGAWAPAGAGGGNDDPRSGKHPAAYRQQGE